MAWTSPSGESASVQGSVAPPAGCRESCSSSPRVARVLCARVRASYSSLRSSRCSRSRSLKQPSEAMLSRTSGSSSPFDGRLRMATRRPGVGSRHGSGSCFPPLGRRRIIANRASPSAETQGSRVPACSFLGKPGVRAPVSPPSHPGVQAQEFGPNLFSTCLPPLGPRSSSP